MKSRFLSMARYIGGLFTDHPDDIGESYIIHFFWSLYYSLCFLIAAIAAFVHAFFPFLFVTTGSTIARKVVDSTDYRRDDI
jgi:hypothetical protein